MVVLNNWRLLVEYDGGGYRGWQSQPGAPTVQGEVEAALATILRQDVKVMGAGRTDAGVHAVGQVANFRVGATIDADLLRRQLNAVLPDDIVVREVAAAHDDFNARRSATARTYSYFILNQPYPSAFWRRYSWWITRRLDLEAARSASLLLIGEHDFSAFTVVKGRSTVRRVLKLEIVDEAGSPGMVRIRITANAFLHHMVRLMVGSLVEVAVGKQPPKFIKEVLDSGDIIRAGPRAPAKGLWLEKVEYPDLSLQIRKNFISLR